MSALRRPLRLNPGAGAWTAPAALSAAERDAMDALHSQLPGGPTRLVRLDAVAQELGVRAVYVKDEGCRFGQPAFKILGASWGAFRALVDGLGLCIDTPLTALREALAAQPIALYAASEGNHGRAVARMASLLSVPSEVHVPHDMHGATRAALEAEGARVVVCDGTYDDALDAARLAAARGGGLLIQDFSFDGYEDVPKVRGPA